jgi:hypothetical protein
MHRSVLLQLSDFPLQNGDLFTQFARHAWAQSWRLQSFEHAGELLTLFRERLLAFRQLRLARPSNNLCRSELMRFQPGHFALTQLRLGPPE